MMTDLLTALYVLIIGMLSLYGLLGLVTLFLYWRHREGTDPATCADPEDLPKVTVQLPIYNEYLVVERLISSVVNLDYPRDKLQIQVIDDSDDETKEVARACVEYYRAQEVLIEHVCRSDRSGYKAGALAEAHQRANGEFLAIFDADFLPNPEFLIETIPHFLADPGLGMIQARWGHLNSSQSSLTAAQAIALDKHFVMEQHVRHRMKMFPKFNGSAGVWRRDCIDDAGGWRSDTVCEDLCLSTRATLRGWEFRYLGDVVAPAELPGSIQAYKSQQARWAKGSIQCLRKYGGQILQDDDHDLLGRLFALLSMSAYSTHILLLLLLLLQLPILLFEVKLPPFLMALALFGIGQPLLFVLAQRVTYRDWAKRLLHFPTLLLVAIGTAPSNSLAIAQSFSDGRPHPFIRTPKGYGLNAGTGISYRQPRDGTLWLEIMLAAYVGLCLVLALVNGQSGALFLLLTSLMGFSYVALLEIRETLAQKTGR